GKKIKTDQIVPDLTNIPTDKMTYRTLSKTGDRISLLGFGTMRYPTVERETPEGVRRFIDEEKAEQLIDYAMAHGINDYDTAWMDHQGASETCTGQILKKYPRHSVYVSTKLPGSGKSREDAIATYDKQMEELRIHYSDYNHLHSPSSDSMYERIY